MIRIPQVRVVDEEGAQLGVMPTPRPSRWRRSGARPRRGRPDGGSAGGQVPRLRAVQVRADEAGEGEQAPAALGDLQGSPALAEDRLGRLRDEGPSGDRVPRGRRPDQGHGPLPRPGADPPGARPHCSRGSPTGSRSTGSSSGRRCSRASRCTSRSPRSTSPRSTRRRSGTARPNGRASAADAAAAAAAGRAPAAAAAPAPGRQPAAGGNGNGRGDAGSGTGGDTAEPAPAPAPTAGSRRTSAEPHDRRPTAAEATAEPAPAATGE